MIVHLLCFRKVPKTCQPSRQNDCVVFPHRFMLRRCCDEKKVKPFRYEKISTISDFRQNSTTDLSLLRDFKSAKMLAISLFVSKILG